MAAASAVVESSRWAVRAAAAVKERADGLEVMRVRAMARAGVAAAPTEEAAAAVRVAAAQAAATAEVRRAVEVAMAVVEMVGVMVGVATEALEAAVRWAAATEVGTAEGARVVATAAARGVEVMAGALAVVRVAVARGAARAGG